jgi:MYXO-CTERM domain-containing protein
MRRLSLLSSLSIALAALTLGGAASAASPVITKTGAYRPQGASLTAASSTPELGVAATSVLSDQVAASRAVTFGPARVVKLASGDRVVKLPQMHKGLMVVHHGAAVTFDKETARIVSARLETDLPDDVTPAVTSQIASSTAEARTGLPVDENDIALTLWPTPDGVRLAWAMSSVAVSGLAYRPVTVVDAKTGEIIYVYNSVLELNQAKVYPTNPVKSPGLIDVTLPVGAGNTVLQNALVQSLNCIDTKKLKPIDFGGGLMLDIHVCELLQTAAPDANGDYAIAPAGDTDPEDAFSEVSMFHHVNRIYDMFRVWDPALDVNNGLPIATVSNLRMPQGFDTFNLMQLQDPELELVPFQNAFFSPANPLFSTVFGVSGGAMYFGQGPIKDYSYDGDVVYHEFGHAVVNVTLKLVQTPHMDEYGASASPGAMNEGLADYFSSALAGDGDCGEYATQDFFPGSKAIRSLTNPDSCPTAISGEVHQDATLFSAGLWDVRVTLQGAEQGQFDAAIFAAMNASPTGDLGYEEFAELAIAEVKTSLGDATAKALSDAFTKRGVLPQCTRILEHTGDTLTGPKELQNLWFAPGTQTTGVTNTLGKWTPGVFQAHSVLPAGTTKIDLSIRAVNIGGGGIGIGGMATPFAPKFLVHFGKEPITFKYKPLAPVVDIQALDGEKDGMNYSVTVDVPPGSTDVWVMVGSTGEADGAFTNLDLIPTSDPMTSGTGGSPGTGGAGGTGGGTGGTGGSGESGSGGSDQTVQGGCGCSLPGTGAPEGATFAAIAALGLIAARRRRR